MKKENVQGMTFRSAATLRSAYFFSQVAASSHRDVTHEMAKAAILFASLSVEAFVNDLERLLNPSSTNQVSFGDGKIDALADILPDLEKQRIQIRSKVQIINFILSGKRIDKGSAPFQNYSLLVDLRNRLTHGRPAMMHFPKNVALPLPEDLSFIKKLAAAGALESDEEFFLDWERAAARPSCAIWSYKTSRQMIFHIIDAFPIESMKQSIKTLLSAPD